MIGFVTPDLKAAIHITLLDSENKLQKAEVFVDTGFNGELSLSPEAIAQYGFTCVDEVDVQLADGSNVSLPIFAALVQWYGLSREITIISTNGDAVLGMRLLENHELKIEVRNGGTVTIESLS